MTGWLIVGGLVLGYCRTRFVYLILLAIPVGAIELLHAFERFPNLYPFSNAEEIGYAIGAVIAPFILGTLFFGVGYYFGKKDKLDKSEH